MTDECLQIQQLLNQEDDDIERDDFGHVKVGTLWNIISGAWYRRWRASKGLTNHGIQETFDPQVPLGPIDNSDLLLAPDTYYRGDGSSYLDWITKQKIVLEDDYYIFPPKAWKLLSERYGVQPHTEVQRYSISVRGKETQVEVTLRKLHLSVLSIPERKLLPPKDIYFSRKATLPEIKARVSQVMKGLVREDLLLPGNHRIWKLDQYSSFESDVKQPFDASEVGVLLDFPGRLLTDDKDTLDTAEVMNDATLLAEFKETEGNWLYRNEGKKKTVIKCGYCNKTLESQPFVCECKKVLRT